MRIKFIFSVLVFLISAPSFATLIQGQNRAYADKKIDFFQYSDPVTLDKNFVFTLEIDNEGNFHTNVNIEIPTFVFADFGIFRGMIFLEPDKPITLLLPPYREKSFADQKNPYFRPVEFWLATKNGNLLNDQVSAFDARLNELTDRYFNQLYFRQSQPVFDSVQVILESQFGTISNEAFIWHKKLKNKAVETDAFRLNPKKVAPVFLGLKPTFYNHPAFIELFEKTFTGKLSYEASAVGGNNIKEAVLKEDIPFFLNLLKEEYQVTGTLGNIALLKMLHDGFYSGNFPQNEILKMVASAHFSNNPDAYIRQVSGNVLKKLQFLREGSRAPVICLKNTDGHRVCTNETSHEKRKFKYLIFADTEMIVCREHLKYLTRTEEQFVNNLEIIVVLRKTDLIEMKVFLVEEKIPGVHLVDENGEYTERYRVKSFPTCFLLSADHEVVFQEAKAPLDGFEQQFAPFLRQKLFEMQRNQSR